MAELYLNSTTKKVLDSYLSEPAHAVCLIGEKGVGLLTIASYLATELSSSSQTITTILPDKGSIPIERIRNLYAETRNIQDKARVFIIDDAEAMSIPAQNALLKLLEEPVKNIQFILTSHTINAILPTIRSRMQLVTILPVDEKTSKAIVANSSLSENERSQALFLAKGHPAELIRLSTDKKYFSSRVEVVTDARTFLQHDTYKRLEIIKSYTDRAQALAFLSMCTELLSFSLLKTKNYNAADQMEYFDEVMQRIEANGHVRTHLMHLVTKLA